MKAASSGSDTPAGLVDDMTAPRFSVNAPAPGHTPTVARKFTGTKVTGGRTYATNLRCSCGFSTRVLNEAPSRGGNRAAARHYLAHLEREGVE